ncbi:SMP-30/gluconolactonase/LRE family protein [Schumannella luteola]
MIAELAAAGTALLGEAPRALSIGGVRGVYFTDLLTGTVYRLDGAESPVALEFPGETASAIIPLDDGRTVIALHRSLAVLGTDGGVEGRIELDLPAGTRLSDATAGPSGHLWLGVVPAADEPAPGQLLRLGDDGVHVVREGLGFSNGLGFTADGSRLLHIDSTPGIVWSIPHDPATGELGEPEEYYVHDELGALDGLCLDEHDRVWVAVFGGGEVLCLEAGAVAQRILVPALRVSSCVIDGRTLVITTARIDAPEEELAEFPLSGSLFRFELDASNGPVWEGHLS